MPNFSEEYKKLVKDIEDNISNPKEKKYVLNQINEISCMYMDLIDRITRLDDTRIDMLEEKQEKIIATLSKIKESVDLIKNDIYEEDSYDFEIVCPYCNHEFVADIESELKEEIECPECHNMIELDWNGDYNDEDSINENHCAGCHGCDDKQESQDNNQEDGNQDDDDM